jgi:branched-chain amino acid transport system substrate-binding protein
MFVRKISGLALLAAAVLASPGALAQVSDDVIKIGVLTDMNGPASTPTGQGSVTAAQMAVDDFGGTVLGKPITVIVGDHQDKPDIGAGIARRWYDTEQVDLIVDVPVSAVGLAVQNIANEKKRMFIAHLTGAADFHGKCCSPYAMQCGINFCVKWRVLQPRSSFTNATIPKMLNTPPDSSERRTQSSTRLRR